MGRDPLNLKKNWQYRNVPRSKIGEVERLARQNCEIATYFDTYKNCVYGCQKSHCVYRQIMDSFVEVIEENTNIKKENRKLRKRLDKRN